MMARLLVALLVCIGCHGGDGGGDGGPSESTDSQTGNMHPLTPADEAAIAEYARDSCGLYFRCGVPLYQDLEACIEVMSCSARSLLESAPITRDQLLACSRSIAGITCDQTTVPMNNACMQLSATVVGALDLETGCDGVTCDSASYCDRSYSRCPRCAPRAALGAPCVGVECVRGGYCNTSTRLCEAVRMEGMACEQDSGCRQTGVFGPAAWLVCREGVCSAPAELGDACEDGSDCALYLACREGVCSELKRAGEPCTLHGECLQWHSCVQGACQEICGLKVQSIGEPCAFDLHCRDAFCDPDTSMCAALQAVSAPCSSSEQCAAGLFCDPASDTCAARGGDGAACQLHDACTSDFCNEQQCQQPICN